MEVITNILEVVKQNYATYGYLIIFLGAFLENTIFLGLILPGGSLVLLGAIYAADGTLSLPLVILFGWIGMFLGNSTDYWLGRLGIYKLIEKTRLKKYLNPHMEKADKFLDERGGIAVFISHFIGHLRSFVAMTAGAVKFPYPRFAGYEVVAALIWNLIYCLAGYFLAESVGSVDGVFSTIAIGMIGLTLAGYLGYKLFVRLTKQDQVGIKPIQTVKESE